MRKPVIAGNWKMNLSKSQAVALANQIAAHPLADIDVIICPPFVYLDAVKGVALGAQDVYFQDSGAFTGEVSCPMLKDVGCRYVIVGHSERRQFFGDDGMVRQKLESILKHGMIPIFCVGETLEQREKNQTLQVIKAQLDAGLIDNKMIIAYEPVWAIGTGKVATAQQAQDVHAFIRNTIASDQIRILYGGSVKPDNIAELMRMKDIDGALVGGASLDAGSFIQIIENAKTATQKGEMRHV